MRILLIILGSLSLLMGVIGIAIPLLPTTPFLLLAAGLYYRSSPKLYDRLMNSRHLGHYISQFREHRALTIRTKVVIITMLWGVMIWRMVAMDILWLRILLPIIAVAVTWHILSFKTLEK